MALQQTIKLQEEAYRHLISIHRYMIISPIARSWPKGLHEDIQKLKARLPQPKYVQDHKHLRIAYLDGRVSMGPHGEFLGFTKENTQ